jgi:hypothetical protein
MASTGPITLDEVRSAIRQVLVVGQRYVARDGTAYSMADLATLRAMEQELKSAAAASAAGVSDFSGYGYFPATFGGQGGGCR